MTNQELYDAIAFAFEKSIRISYDERNEERQRALLNHLKGLLGVQLDRATGIVKLPVGMKFHPESTIAQPSNVR